MDHIRKKLNRLGFQVDVSGNRDFSGRRNRVPYNVNVITDRKRQERFLIELGIGVDAQVLDTRPHQRALLLMVRDGNSAPGDGNPAKMLLGRDERHLFVAAVPRNATTVLGAMTALKPTEIMEAERRSGVKRKRLQKRKNKARLRQGDFFFLPAPDLVVPEETILRNEPINRGRGASHMVEFLYRRGGELVWVCGRHPNGITPEEYQRLVDADPDVRHWGWRRQVRNAEVYAKGRITHREHATIVLKSWNRVLPNTESEFAAFEDMVFID